MAMSTLTSQRKRMPGVAERHADEVDFLWPMRDSATNSTAHDLDTLARWDERLDAHLDGLRFAGDHGWNAALDLLKSKAEQDKGWGSAFGAAWMAVEQADFEWFAAVLDLAVGGNRGGDKAIIAALAFASPERAQRFLRPLVTAKHAILQRMGIAAAAAHGHNLGEDLATALGGADSALRTRAARAVGQLGRRDLLRALEFLHDDSDPHCRYAAVWAGAVLSDSTAAQMLWSFCQPNAPFLEEAICLAAVMNPLDAPRKIREFADRGGDVRAALVGVAALGDSALVPWLFEQMRSPDHARLAANALVCLTGINLPVKRLIVKPPPAIRLGPNDDPNDENVAMDPDHGLPWPNVDALQTWWSGVRREYPAGTRFWLGKPIDQGGAEAALRAGNQKLRRAAAWYLAKMAPGRGLFEVRAPAMRQRALLGGP
jgi:uncharacterized protein (TIGR02270 family)